MGRHFTRGLWLFAVLACTARAHAEGVCAEGQLLSAPEPMQRELAPDPEPLHDDELPWCTSADDPHCAPLPGHGTPSHQPLRLSIGIVALPSAQLPQVSPQAEKHTACAGLSEAAGARLRLERPPRA